MFSTKVPFQGKEESLQSGTKAEYTNEDEQQDKIHKHKAQNYSTKRKIKN